jgi:hypothetical protein
MVTAVISDLHLGTRTGSDLLRRREIRRRLMTELEEVDHLVLLGDSLDLRAGPAVHALEAAAPFFDDLGAAMAGRRVTIVAGNHDHQLVSGWLRDATDGRLGLEQLGESRPNDLLTRLARRMPAVDLVPAYPGVWLRADVYATHGHYLDCHNDVATFECLASAVSERLTRAPRGGYRTPAEYEAVLAPVYRAIDRLAQSSRTQGLASAARAVVRGWESAGGYRGPRSARGRRFARVAVRPALGALDRLGLGTFDAGPPRDGARRPGLAAMARVVDGLGIEARYVVFGHLHRAGPLAGEEDTWRTASGRQLVNAGCWVYEPAYLGAAPGRSPYRPGGLVLVREDGPPELRHVLDERLLADLASKNG